VIIIKNSRKVWRGFTREEFLARALYLIVKIFQQKIFDAKAAYLMICLCIASSVRSGLAPRKKVTLDVTSAMNSPVSILNLKYYMATVAISDSFFNYVSLSSPPGSLMQPT